MRILHLCLACFYIDGYNYQENVLPRINKEDGNEVYIIASTETYIDNKHLGYIQPGEYVTEYGVPIKRLPYVKIFNQYVSSKLRFYPNLYKEIEKINPDVIMCHDIAFGSVLDVIKYKKQHTEVKIYADTHTAYYNSGQNWLSMNILHKIYYKWLIKQALPYLEKYFYIGEGERVFSKEVYDIPENIMEYYPLGGNIPTEEEYRLMREKKRKELKVAEDELLLVHSGKLDKLKRTEDLLKAFEAVQELKAKLAIIGSIPDDMRSILEPLMEQDNRVKYLGWKSGIELQEYLCACDLYCQPGSTSATLQNAVCRNCAIMAYPHKAYTKDLDFGNFVWVKSLDDIKESFKELAQGKIDLAKLQKNSARCAKELLDYKKLAARLYE